MYLFWSDTNIWRRSIPMKETFPKYRRRSWVDGKLNKSMSVVKRPYTCRQYGSSGACPSFSSSTEILTLSIRLDTIADLPREYVKWLNSVDIDRSGLIGWFCPLFSPLSFLFFYLFFFTRCDTSDTGLIIGNEKTRLITDDSFWAARMKIRPRRNSRGIGCIFSINLQRIYMYRWKYVLANVLTKFRNTAWWNFARKYFDCHNELTICCVEMLNNKWR